MYENYVLCVSWIILFVLFSALLLTGPNSLTRSFHMASEDFNRNDSTSVPWRMYQQAQADENPGTVPADYASAAMPLEFRWKLWGLGVASFVCSAFWEGVVVEGPVSKWVRKTYPSDRIRLEI